MPGYFFLLAIMYHMPQAMFVHALFNEIAFISEDLKKVAFWGMKKLTEPTSLEETILGNFHLDEDLC